MCGRYTLFKLELLLRHFPALQLPPDLTPRYNIAPSQDVPVIRLDKDGQPVVGLVNWGLVPHWTKGKPRSKPINARAETIATSGMFRQAFERRRCLVPADGFYEWRKIDDKAKQPMYVTRRDGEPFAFAGLWERWRLDPEAEPVDTFTIVTTTPNELMAPIHDRMPVIIGRADYARWLDRDVAGVDVAGLLRPYPAEEMEAHPVSKLVNNPRNESGECVRPLVQPDANARPKALDASE